MVREQLRFGAWNIRTMTGREEELVEEMKKYRLEMLGVSETKARGNGEKAIGDVRCVFSGVQAGRARAGVAVLLSERLGRCLKEWKCVDERILKIRLKIEGRWLTVIQVYAPTDDSSREVKAEFFGRLQETVGSVARGDVLVVMGDLNARVGNDTEVWGEILGKHGEAACNGNGRQLLQFCSENNLAVSNSWFQHKRIHQFTWECRGRGLKSIIDYFLVRREHMRRVKDVKVVRGAEVGSDHYLVLMKIQMRIIERRECTGNVRKGRIRVWKLKNAGVRRVYQNAMVRRSREVKHAIQQGSVEEGWNVVKECMLVSAAKACGIEKSRNGRMKRTRWWNDEVQCAVRRKKMMYKQMLDVGTEEARQRYTEAKAEARRVVRKAKK